MLIEKWNVSQQNGFKCPHIKPDYDIIIWIHNISTLLTFIAFLCDIQTWTVLHIFCFFIFFGKKREYLQYALVRSYVRFLIKRILWNKIFLERKLFIVILIYSRIMSVKLKEIFMFVLSTTLSYSMWVKYLRFNIEYILYYAFLWNVKIDSCT